MFVSLFLCLFCLANVSSQNIPTINCATMMPDRVSTIGPQTGPSPFKIKVQGKTYKAGTPLIGKSYESLLLWLCFIYSVKCRIFGVCTILKNCMHLRFTGFSKSIWHGTKSLLTESFKIDTIWIKRQNQYGWLLLSKCAYLLWCLDNPCSICLLRHIFMFVQCPQPVCSPHWLWIQW